MFQFKTIQHQKKGASFHTKQWLTDGTFPKKMPNVYWLQQNLIKSAISAKGN